MSAGAEALRSLGVPERTLDGLADAEAAKLDGEIERFVAYGYGQASQRRFLAAPHPGLGLRSPLETLAEPGGADEVLAVVRAQLAALEQAR